MTAASEGTSRLRALLGDTRLLVEAFAWGNLAFLAVDVYVAHSYNEFAEWPEWIPVAFSGAAPVVAAIVMGAARVLGRTRAAAKWIGIVVGVLALGVGIGGMILHLESSFFARTTLDNLVYTAPFAAPLAYAGVGLLLLADRLIRDDDMEWARWIVFLALGGFVGNFALSLADHAQNGFFDAREWIPVIASAVAVGCLLAVVVWPRDAMLRRVTVVVLAGQVLVGLAGVWLHVNASLQGAMDTLWGRTVYGAPLFAPLLFPNLALLAWLGLRALRREAPEVAPAQETQQPTA